MRLAYRRLERQRERKKRTADKFHGLYADAESNNFTDFAAMDHSDHERSDGDEMRITPHPKNARLKFASSSHKDES